MVTGDAASAKPLHDVPNNCKENRTPTVQPANFSRKVIMSYHTITYVSAATTSHQCSGDERWIEWLSTQTVCPVHRTSSLEINPRKRQGNGTMRALYCFDAMIGS